MTALAPSQQQPRRHWFLWILLFLLILLAGVIVLGLFIFSAEWVQASAFLPVALHSGLRADYSADLRAYSFRALQMGVVEEAIRDRERLGEPVGGNMLPTLSIFLQTPVPTITPTAFFPQNGTPTLPVSPTPTQISLDLSPTALVTPTLTLAFSPTPTLVVTHTPTRTLVPTFPVSSPTRTPVFTSTIGIPTATPLPPTPTSLPPTATRVPTNPPPTPTPLPPTPTPYQPPVEPSPPTPYP